MNFRRSKASENETQGLGRVGRPEVCVCFAAECGKLSSFGAKIQENGLPLLRVSAQALLENKLVAYGVLATSFHDCSESKTAALSCCCNLLSYSAHSNAALGIFSSCLLLLCAAALIT